MRRIIFLSDTPPFKSKGAGISVLLFNILSSLSIRYSLGVVTFCKENPAGYKDIIQDNKSAHLLVCDSYLRRIYSKIPFGIIKNFLQGTAFIFSLPKLFTFVKNDDVIITMVGASGRPLWKSLSIMFLKPRSKHLLYIVDDLELINKRLNNKFERLIIHLLLRLVVKKSDGLMTISYGLRDLYLNKYDKDSVIFHPHYTHVERLEENTLRNNSFTFLFTGGLNLLYNDSLQLFARALQQLNINSHILFKLVVQTYSSKEDFENLQFNPEIVSYSHCEDRTKLRQIYQACDAFIVPYSFLSENSGLVATSFPQKIAEIIQYGRKVLFFGPQYSSVNRFFNSNHLDYRISSDNIDDLKLIINRLVDGQDICDQYSIAYETHFSSTAVLNVFDKICAI